MLKRGGGDVLRPIPKRILRTTVVAKVATGVDVYQEPTFDSYVIKNVHIQPTTEIRKTATNTDQQLRSILFADCRYSTPFAWDEMLQSAHAIGGDVKVISGNIEYTVLTVDALRDDTDRLHHYEVGLV